MQAISKDKHEKFCKLIGSVSSSLVLQDDKLSNLETELDSLFKAYRQQLNDLKLLILEYDVKQKNIRSLIRQLLREANSAQNFKHFPVSP